MSSGRTRTPSRSRTSSPPRCGATRRSTAWELWNEPNFARFSKPRPDPAGFVEFLRSARRARDSVGSTAKLISGGIAPGGEIDVHDWINEVAMRGGLNLIDGFGVHPVQPGRARRPALLDDAARRRCTERLAKLGRPDLPLWLTEYGAPTVPVANGYAPALSEQQQADRLRTAVRARRRASTGSRTSPGTSTATAAPSRPSRSATSGWCARTCPHKPAYDAPARGGRGRRPPSCARGCVLSTRIRRLASGGARRSKRSAEPSGAPSRKRRRRSAARAKHDTVNRITVSGKLTLPGTPWPEHASSRCCCRAAAGRRKAVAGRREGGIFWARFEGRGAALGDARGPLRPGYSRTIHQPLDGARFRSLSSATTRR